MKPLSVLPYLRYPASRSYSTMKLTNRRKDRSVNNNGSVAAAAVVVLVAATHLHKSGFVLHPIATLRRSKITEMHQEMDEELKL